MSEIADVSTPSNSLANKIEILGHWGPLYPLGNVEPNGELGRAGPNNNMTTHVDYYPILTLEGNYCQPLGKETCINLGAGVSYYSRSDGDPNSHYQDETNPDTGKISVIDPGIYLNYKYTSLQGKVGLSQFLPPLFAIRPSLLLGYHSFQAHMEQGELSNGSRVIGKAESMDSKGLLLGAGLGFYALLDPLIVGATANGLLMFGDKTRTAMIPQVSLGGRF